MSFAREVTMNSRDVTLTDVAKACGVAVSTVSRAFARPGRVNASTAERIFRVANELGYQRDDIPLTWHRSAGLNRLIAITVADIANPIYASYVSSAQRVCLNEGFGLIVVSFQEHTSIEKNMLRLTQNHVDGVILASSRLPENGIRKLASLLPVVALNRPVHGVQSILSDPRQGLDQMLSRLRHLGHDSITYLAGPVASWQDGSRWSNLLELCPKYQIRLARIASASPTYQGGYRCREAFLTNPTSSVLAFNDNIAIGFAAALRDCGVDVPSQVSIAGFDDTPVDMLLTPTMSSIRMNRQEIGEKAAELMLTRIRGGEQAKAYDPVIVADSTFMERGTTAKARTTSL